MFRVYSIKIKNFTIKITIEDSWVAASRFLLKNSSLAFKMQSGVFWYQADECVHENFYLRLPRVNKSIPIYYTKSDAKFAFFKDKSQQTPKLNKRVFFHCVASPIKFAQKLIYYKYIIIMYFADTIDWKETFIFNLYKFSLRNFHKSHIWIYVARSTYDELYVERATHLLICGPIDI